MTKTGPQLVAHRGYAYRYPENTLLAVKAAVDAGASYIEVDVLLSSDQVPVLFHDRDCQRMCSRAGAIHDYSYAQLAEFSVAQVDTFHDQYLDNRITRVDELVAYLRGAEGVTLFVELKRQAIDHFGIDTMLARVLPLLQPIARQVVIISYNIESLLACRQQADYPVGAVFDDWQEKDHPLIQQLQPQYMFTDINKLPANGPLHCPGTQLAVYECIDPSQALDVHRRGVDLVETFRIAEMLAAFAHKQANEAV